MCDLRIINGRFSADGNVDKYTCHTYNGSSVVDYFICTPDLFQNINDFHVKDAVVYSDHCPIILELNAPQLNRRCGTESAVSKMIWDADKINEYRLNLQNYSSAKFDEMLSIIDSPNTDNLSSSVNEAVVAFTDGIRLAADPYFSEDF